MNEKRHITTVINDKVGSIGVGPGYSLHGAPPILLQGLSLPREHIGAFGLGNGSGGVIGRREDVAGAPTKLGAELLQRFDQHRRLSKTVSAQPNASRTWCW